MLEIIRILDDMQIESNGTGSKETLETYEDEETDGDSSYRGHTEGFSHSLRGCG